MAPATHPQTDEDWQARIYDAIDAFSPGAPIDDLNLLAGRAKQIDQMLDAVLQRGQHAILYGERGVGKSSLANTFYTKLIGPTRTRSCIHINVFKDRKRLVSIDCRISFFSYYCNISGPASEKNCNTLKTTAWPSC